MTRRAASALTFLCFALVALGLYLPLRYHGLYLLYHSLVELFSIVIAGGIFVLAWNCRRLQISGYLLFLGIAYSFAGSLDALHMLAYRNMGVFHARMNGANLPTQLWICARFVQAISLLLAPLFIQRKVNVGVAATAMAAAIALLILAVFTGVFPVCFRDQIGLTRFKVISEYIICAILVASVLLLWRSRRHFDTHVLDLVLGSLLLTVLSELVFTLYTDPTGLANWFGHCLKVAAFYLVYRAIVVTGLTRPYDLLFRDLQQAKAAAESANRAKDQFLAVLSHELRNPLSPVLLAVSGISCQLPPDHPMREDLDLIRRNVELEARLIDDLLDLTRIARGKLELSCKTVDAHQFLQHALEICQADIAAKRLQVHIDQQAQHHVVHGDPARLQQVFWNLIKNAVKFTPAQGSISLRTWNEPHPPRDGQPHPHLFIEVSDTGIGIEPDVLPRIFNAFEQGGSDITRQFGGLGLGLAITKAIVDMHGGSIAGRSEGKGHGATFRVQLPLVSATAAPLSAGPHPSPPATDNGQRKADKLRILLVEDHEDTSRIMARLLRSLQFSVETAGTVQSALNAARTHPFDLVISDLGLPDGSGLDLIRQLKAQYSLKGIALTGFGMERDIQASRQAGFDEHMTKPVDFQKLQEVIHRLATP